MKVVSYYSITPDWIKYFCSYWDWMAEVLPRELGKGDEVVLVPGLENRLVQKKVLNYFEPITGKFDVAFVERFNIPTKRLGGFVYTMLGDYIGLEELTYQFLEQLRPNLVCSLQHYKEDLASMCTQLGIQFLYFPWFVDRIPEYSEYRPIVGMISGGIGWPYPIRTKIHDYLKALKREDILISCSLDVGKYPLSTKAYFDGLRKTKYYFSAGILDFQIPPKFMEACSQGACLVSPDLPMMENCGFIDGETYIEFKGLEQIKELFNSDVWQRIGRNGRLLIKEKHTTKVRAEQLIRCME